MRNARTPLILLAPLAVAVACGSVPDETQPPPAGRLIQPAGVIRGNVVYSGPHPCSSNGHIVGSAIVLVFDRRNPPPPAGLATTALNFGVVTGDALFADEPRNAGAAPCVPQQGGTDTITVSAPFAIAPLDPGSYVLEAFYDTTGDFLPTFKFRNLPEQGDVGGGDIDTADALKPINLGNLDYQPHFLPVDVGIPQPLSPKAPPGAVPNFVIPDAGFVADNVTVTLGQVLPLPRPYFYPLGSDVPFSASDPATFQVGPPLADGSPPPPDMDSVDVTPDLKPTYAPVLTVPQDIEVYAPPAVVNRANVDNYESRFPHLVLQGGLPSGEQAIATSPSQPFHFQLPPSGGGVLSLWQNAAFDAAAQVWVPQDIPEGQATPYLWPLVVLTKLVDDPRHTGDPASLLQQGSTTDPVVILQAITLLGESGSSMLFDTMMAASGGALFDPSGRPKVMQQNQVTVLLRPSVICFDSLFNPTDPDKRGTLVTPYLLGLSADLPTGTPDSATVPPSTLTNPQVASLVKAPYVACLPTGRYAINVVYPDGQAWTVPNEAGGCSGTEGTTDTSKSPPECTLTPRPVLTSQGPRAVVEIVATKDPNHCQGPAAVPSFCLPAGSAPDAGAH